MSTVAPALADAIRGQPPRFAVVLGSGLGLIAERARPDLVLPFRDCPPLVETHVHGHAGRVILGQWCGQRALVFAGRNHFYEGHNWAVVLGPIRLAASLGVGNVLLTCAAGGIRDDLLPGTLMTITGHLNWASRHPWREALQANAYDPGLRDRAVLAARSLPTPLVAGTYAAVTGPNYETPAEIRALRTLGVDAVGMSTAPEAEEAASLGLNCLAIACITNRAAGLTGAPLTHDEVLATSRQQAHRLAMLLERILQQFDHAGGAHPEAV